MPDCAVADGETAVFADFCAHFDISGRRVLEIGGCVPARLTQAAAVWWSVDPAHPESAVHGHQVRLRAMAEDLAAEICDVDLVFACNSFQHVGSIAGCYAAIAKVLAPGGAVFAHFGPIWTAPDGMHFENVALSDGRYDFWLRARMPSWSHLVLQQEDFRALARDLNGAADGDRLADYAAQSSWINRVGLAEHLALPAAAGLKVRDVRGARAFGYAYRPPAPPPRYAHAFEPAALERALARRGVTPAEARIRDLRLILDNGAMSQ